MEKQKTLRLKPEEHLEWGRVRKGLGWERHARDQGPLSGTQGCGGPTIFRPMYSQPGRTDSRKAFRWAPSENRVWPQWGLGGLHTHTHAYPYSWADHDPGEKGMGLGLSLLLLLSGSHRVSRARSLTMPPRVGVSLSLSVALCADLCQGLCIFSPCDFT